MILKNELENKENIKLLILDIDGTLVRFTNLEALMDRVLKEINEEKNDKQFTRYVTAVADILKDSEQNLSFDFKTLCKYINHQKLI